MTIPFFAAEREWAAHGAAFLAAIGEVLATGRSLQGEAVGAFEADLAAATGRDHAVAVGSGTDALSFALIAGGVCPGDDVLVPAFSFIASASCVLRAGARPVFVDVDDDGLLSLEDAAAKRTPQTRALVAVQLFGQMRDPAALEAFAGDLLLVEDAAQSLGATHGARRSGSVGDASALSFDPTKTLSAPGSGGALLTDDDALAGRVRELRWHGRNAERRYTTLGHNSQLPTAAAAVLRIKLRLQDEWTERRRAIAARYDETFEPLPVRSGAGHIFHKYVARSDERDALRTRLEEAGVPTLVHYARGLHREPVFAPSDPAECPNADRLAGEVLSLPIHPFLTDAEVERVVTATSPAARRGARRGP